MCYTLRPIISLCWIKASFFFFTARSTCTGMCSNLFVAEEPQFQREVCGRNNGTLKQYIVRYSQVILHNLIWERFKVCHLLVADELQWEPTAVNAYVCTWYGVVLLLDWNIKGKNTLSKLFNAYLHDIVQ